MAPWQYSPDNGTTWDQVGSPSTTSALLLAADSTTRLRFTPTTDYSGTASFTFQAWDQTAGVTGSFMDTTSNGGFSPISSVSGSGSIMVTATYNWRRCCWAMPS